MLKKWLGYRQASERDGAPLSLNELKCFRQVVLRIAALLALGERLDAAYTAALTDALTAKELGITRPEET